MLRTSVYGTKRGPKICESKATTSVCHSAAFTSYVLKALGQIVKGSARGTNLSTSDASFCGPDCYLLSLIILCITK